MHYDKQQLQQLFHIMDLQELYTTKKNNIGEKKKMTDQSQLLAHGRVQPDP